MTIFNLSIKWGCMVVLLILSIGSSYAMSSNFEVSQPHNGYCDLFYRLDRCPNGLVYNSKKLHCDLPQNTDCSLTSSGSGSSNFEATKPHGKHCSLFYRLDSCPNGLVYNTATLQCDLPQNTDCGSKQILSSNFPGNTAPGVSPVLPGEAVVDDTILNPKTEKPKDSIILGGECSAMHTCPENIPAGSFVFLPHLTVCNLFCGCDGKKIELYACSKGLSFNPVTQECVSPASANCNPIAPHDLNQNLLAKSTGNGDCRTFQKCPAKEPSDFTLYLPHATDCRFFCRCEHGMTRLDQCAENLHFNPTKQTCDKPNDGLCITTKVEKGVSKESLELCPAEGNCNPGKQDFLPHQSSCVSYCECVNGIPRMRNCTQGLHFNPRSKKCEAPNLALCQGECPKLEKRNATIWTPATCTTGLSKIGDECRVKCADGYELDGSALVKCTKQGWNGIIGPTITPSCKAPEDLGKKFIDNVNKFVKGKTNFLFLLDESGSVSKEQFGSEVSFVKAVVSQFPLSENRTAGTITFSSSAAVDVHMTHADSCKFFVAIDTIKYSGGGTDILLAIKTAITEIDSYSRNVKTLVFLITDGEHRAPGNPKVAADELKKKGHILFTIGVGKYLRDQLQLLATPGNDGVPLFFGLTNFKAFDKIAEYLHTVHGYGATLNCVVPNSG